MRRKKKMCSGGARGVSRVWPCDLTAFFSNSSTEQVHLKKRGLPRLPNIDFVNQNKYLCSIFLINLAWLSSNKRGIICLNNSIYFTLLRHSFRISRSVWWEGGSAPAPLYSSVAGAAVLIGSKKLRADNKWFSRFELYLNNMRSL